MEDQDIAELARSGRKIEAIKRYRERHGTDLRQSAEGVEALEAGLPPTPPQARPDAGLFSEQIDHCIREGKAIEAIRLYREVHGVGLKEAKNALDARARELGAVSRSGCLALPAGLLTLVIALAVLLAR